MLLAELPDKTGASTWAETHLNDPASEAFTCGLCRNEGFDQAPHVPLLTRRVRREHRPPAEGSIGFADEDSYRRKVHRRQVPGRSMAVESLRAQSRKCSFILRPSRQVRLDKRWRPLPASATEVQRRARRGGKFVDTLG